MTKYKRDNPALKVLISVGGTKAGSRSFREIISTEASRRKFIQHAVGFLHAHAFDGLDVDWEYPLLGDRNGFTILLHVRIMNIQFAQRNLFRIGIHLNFICYW